MCDFVTMHPQHGVILLENTESLHKRATHTIIGAVARISGNLAAAPPPFVRSNYAQRNRYGNTATQERVLWPRVV